MPSKGGGNCKSAFLVFRFTPVRGGWADVDILECNAILVETFPQNLCVFRCLRSFLGQTYIFVHEYSFKQKHIRLDLTVLKGS